ncbi:MAG TPA: hypothetical protein VJM31_04545 [Vicinamibacterales bacterium]|nr:hypothetical protein [Vicinamibacterales bacterium]
MVGVLLSVLCPFKALAQERLAVRSDILLYGDNTEFRNPFREGETIFGAALRVAAVVDLNERVALSLGAFGNQRFGSSDAFEQVRPVIALTVRGKRSTFVFGTLPAPTVKVPSGPDRGGPHGLLPALQRETLMYQRPYESGLAWTFNGRAIRHDFWLEWQRLNTPEHRERLDGGLKASPRVTDRLAIPLQMHVVHEGGQLYASGAVADSVAAATGVELQHTMRGTLASLELYGLVSRHVPDRSLPALSQDGAAFFGRVSGERSGWRGHAIFWRGRNFIKDEGDLNYLSIRRNGERYSGTRDYAEAGLTRRFTLSPFAMLEASGRVHRVEHHYEYSYRVMSVVSTSWMVR